MMILTQDFMYIKGLVVILAVSLEMMTVAMDIYLLHPSMYMLERVTISHGMIGGKIKVLSFNL